MSEDVGNTTEINAPPVMKRNPFAWVLLVVLVLALIILQLSPSKPGKAESAGSASTLETELKLQMVARKFAISADPALNGSAYKDSNRKLEEIYERAQKEAKTDVDSARITLAVGDLLEKPANPSAIRLLETKKDQENATFLKIYSGERFDFDWARSTKSLLPPTFIGKLAHAQALEKAGKKDQVLEVVSSSDSMAIILVFGGVLLSLAIGIMVLIGAAVFKASGGLKHEGYAIGNVGVPGADRLAFRMCVFLAGLFLVPGLVAALFRGPLPVGVGAVIGELVFFAGFLWFLKTPVSGISDPIKKVLGKTDNWPRLVGVGLLGFFANLPILVITATLGTLIFKDAPAPTHPLTEQLGSGVSPISLIMMFLIVSVLAPLLEELSFRGLLFPALGQFMKPFAAMLLSGFVFGAIHPQGPVLWASLAAIGAMGAYLAHLTGSLIPSMVMHCVHNTAILTLSLVLLY